MTLRDVFYLRCPNAPSEAVQKQRIERFLRTGDGSSQLQLERTIELFKSMAPITVSNIENLYPFRDVFSAPKGGGTLEELGYEDLEFYGINTAVAKEAPDHEGELPKIHYKALRGNAKARMTKEAKARVIAERYIIPAGDHPQWSDKILEEAKTYDYEKAKEVLKGEIRFQRETDYDAFLLSLAQTYIVDMLPRVFYLAFEGPKSAGKSSATSMWAYLAYETYQAGQITAAVLANIMEKAKGLAIDEADKLSAREDGEVHIAILRQGTDPNSPYMKMHEVVREGVRTQEIQQIKTFGPKCFNFSRVMEDALMSRSDLIRMNPTQIPKLRRRTRHFRTRLAPLKAWIEMCGERANREWTAALVENYESTEEFVQISDSMNPQIPRYGEIGDLMTITAKVFGWEAFEAITDRINGLLSVIDDEVEEVRVCVLECINDAGDYSIIESGGEVPLIRENIRNYLNKKRRNYNTMGPQRFNELLKELGFFNLTLREKRGARRRMILVTKQNLTKLLPTPQVMATEENLKKKGGDMISEKKAETYVEASPETPMWYEPEYLWAEKRHQEQADQLTRDAEAYERSKKPFPDI